MAIEKLRKKTFTYQEKNGFREEQGANMLTGGKP